MLCLLGHLGRSGARGAPATAADAGELVEARGDIVGRFGGSLELIVQVLRRFVPDMQDLFAQLERQLGEGDVEAAPRPCIPSRAALPPLAPAPLAGRASELEQALRRADPLRGMEILAGIRLDELRTLCDACSPPAGDVRRRAGGVGELNPGAVASPAKDSGGPGARLHPLRPVGRITPWALSADTLKPAQVLSDILFLSFSTFRRRAAVMGVEQGVGDFRALLQAAADGGGNRLAGLAAEPRLLLEAHADAAHAAHLAEGRGDPQADAQLFLHAPQQVFQVFQAAQGFQASGQALLFLAGQEEDATVRAGRLQALAFTDAGAGRAGLAEGGEALMAPS